MIAKTKLAQPIQAAHKQWNSLLVVIMGLETSKVYKLEKGTSNVCPWPNAFGLHPDSSEGPSSHSTVATLTCSHGHIIFHATSMLDSV